MDVMYNPVGWGQGAVTKYLVICVEDESLVN
jgi:hypothetical protein